MLKIIKKDDNKYVLNLIKYSKMDDYFKKGIRLVSNLTIEKALKELSNESFTTYAYEGKNFVIPANNNIIIKNVEQLKDYLDEVSYKTIILSKSFDTNKDGVIDLITYREKENLKPKNITSLNATIYYLKNAAKTGKEIQNKNFAKEMFIDNLKEIISSLKGLQ
jgi:hypothetical protein